MADQQDASPKRWTKPQIVSVGSVEDQTGSGTTNIRDNAGDSDPKYVWKSAGTPGEVDLPHGE